MRMYPKEIRSLKQLEQEKKRLHKQLDELEDQELFSMSSLMSRGNKKKGAKDEEDGGFDLSSLIAMLPISNPIIKTVLPLVQSRVMALLQRKAAPVAGATIAATESATAQTTGQKVKHAALAVGKDIVIGYLKWKAIELTFKGVRHLVNKQKEKREAAIN